MYFLNASHQLEAHQTFSTQPSTTEASVDGIVPPVTIPPQYGADFFNSQHCGDHPNRLNHAGTLSLALPEPSRPFPEGPVRVYAAFKRIPSIEEIKNYWPHETWDPCYVVLAGIRIGFFYNL